MTLKQKLENDLRAAMKAGDAFKTSVLRMVMTGIRNREIQLLKKDVGLSDEEVIEVLRSEAKKRKDSAQEYRKGGRPELGAKEEEEIGAIKDYLPAEISDEELERVLKDGVREVGAASEADFGKVMKSVMPILKGKASGDRISAVLKRLLS